MKKDSSENEIEYFLESEIISGLYEEIVKFIDNYNIRCGEFECNEHIIKKMNHDNFIVFLEYETDDGVQNICWAMAFYKWQLLDLINSFAKKRGLIYND